MFRFEPCTVKCKLLLLISGQNPDEYRLLNAQYLFWSSVVLAVLFLSPDVHVVWSGLRGGGLS